MDGATLARLEQGMRDAAVGRRAVRALPGLVACIDEASANPFLSEAIPDGVDPDGWAVALDALTAHFANAGRRARIEAFAELRPGLLAAADAAGRSRSRTAPVLVSAAEGALRLCEGLGFVRVGTQVNLEAP